MPGLGTRWRRDWSVRRLGLQAETRPDLLHVLGADQAEAGLAAAEHWQLPYLLTIDTFLPPGSTLRLSRRWARGIIATGDDLAQDLRDGFGVPGELVEVVRSGIPVPEVEETTSDLERVPVVGTSGDVAPGGGVPTLFEAARRLLKEGLDIEFVVDGQRRDESWLRRLAHRMGIIERVTFADEFDVGSAYWRVLDVFCRISNVPDSGDAVGSALAFGVPVVVSDVPGLRSWVIPGETGMVVPPGDAEFLADALRALLSNRLAARGHGLRTREWIIHHNDPEREADALAGLYRHARCRNARTFQPRRRSPRSGPFPGTRGPRPPLSDSHGSGTAPIREQVRTAHPPCQQAALRRPSPSKGRRRRPAACRRPDRAGRPGTRAAEHTRRGTGRAGASAVEDRASSAAA